MDLQNARAVLATGLLAAHADGLHAASEREALRRALERMDARLDLEALEREIVTGRRDLERTASELTTHEARELAYELAVSVCDADGEANAEERTFLDALERALGIAPESGATLRREAGALATAPLAGKDGTNAGDDEVDVDALILAQALLCGGLELLPQRLATLAILPLQLRLVYRIGKRHGYELDREHAVEFLAVLGVGLASQVIESWARRLVGGLLGGGALGGLGGLASGTVGAGHSFVTTFALGHAAERYYSGGRTLSTQDLRGLFDSLLERGRKLAPRHAGEMLSRARALDPKELVRLVW